MPLTTAQAASRLRSDSSTVAKYIRRGLANGKLKLKAKKVPATHGGLRYQIDAAEVKRFAAERKRLGI